MQFNCEMGVEKQPLLVLRGEKEENKGMSSLRALLVLATFLALPLGAVFLMSHFELFTPDASYQLSLAHEQKVSQMQQVLVPGVHRSWSEKTERQMRFMRGNIP